MKHFRISIDIEIEAKDREHADLRARCFYSDVGQRPWIVDVLPNGIEERITITPTR
jgi:hypothetical protein